MIKRETSRVMGLAMAVALLAAGCESATGSRGETRVLLGTNASASAALFSEGALETSAGSVPLGDVASVELTITRVQALPRNADEGSESSWRSLDVEAGPRVNLLALPQTAENAIVIARGDLPAGTYGNLRVFFSDATVTFTRAVTLGSGANARTYAAGTAHPLTVPSGAQSGIKIPGASFTVSEDAGQDVVIFFEATPSLRNINVTGAGLLMTPVLSARTR